MDDAGERRRSRTDDGGAARENAAEPRHLMKIDELARMVRVTTRTIRTYQNRGLLPEPRRHGRTPYYDARHVARLGLITRLQQAGQSLDAVRALLDPDSVVGEVLLPADRLRGLLRARPSLSRSLEQGGVLGHRVGELVVRAPRAVFAAMGLRRSGVPDATALEVLAELTKRESRRASRTLDELRAALAAWPDLPHEELVTIAVEAYRASLLSIATAVPAPRAPLGKPHKGGISEFADADEIATTLQMTNRTEQ